jgi:hypothetical protein
MSRKLTIRELEILGILQEECAEVIQIISKIRRFGLDSVNPYDPEHLRVSNLVKLHDELGDVQGMIELLKGEDGIIDQSKIDVRTQRKITKVSPYLSK